MPFLSVFSYNRCSNPFIIFMFLCWTCSRLFISLSSKGVQNWTQHFRCISIYTGQYSLLVMLLMSWQHSPSMQTKVLWPFILQGHTVVSCSISCPPGCVGPFLKSCFTSPQPPVWLGVSGVQSSVGAGLPNTPGSPFFQLIEIPLKSSTSSWFIKSFFQFASSADLLRVHSVLSPMSSMKTLKFWTNFGLCGTPQLLGL